MIAVNNEHGVLVSHMNNIVNSDNRNLIYAASWNVFAMSDILRMLYELYYRLKHRDHIFPIVCELRAGDFLYIHDANKCTPITCFDVPSPDVQSSQCHQWLKNLHSSCYVRSCGSIQCRVMRVCIDRNPAHGTGASKWRRLLVSVSKRKLDRLGLGYHHRIQGSRPSPANVSCQWYTWDHQTARITIRNKRKTWFAF